MKLFKPMLAPNESTDTSKLNFPLFASLKLDGIRATVQGGVLMSRNLKPLPNVNIQKVFGALPEGTDGELIYGDPTAEFAFNDTTSIVMSTHKPIDGVRFYIFDAFEHRPFSQRLQTISNTFIVINTAIPIALVDQKLIHDEKELLEFEKEALDAGHEGLMLRSLDSPYKQGRCTLKQGWLLKLKRFVDAEAKIIGFVEEQKNTNEAKTNALGHTERSSKKEGMVGKGTLGKFEVIGINGTYKDVEFSVGGGFTAAQRQDFWINRKKLIGKIIKYKYFPTGSVERPRFPVFKGFRDKRDM